MTASAESIPYVNADEAHRLLTDALERLLRLLASLSADDWSKPTACTAWDVHDMAAHQAGGYASGVSYREMLRQYAQIPKAGQLPEDAINALQVGERKDKSPAELIAELKQTGPRAIHNWAYGFRAVKWIAVPHPVSGLMTLRHLMWVTHSRDTWMHRLDICRAANRPFEQTREHDGRIVALVVRDVAKKLRPRAVWIYIKRWFARGEFYDSHGDDATQLGGDFIVDKNGVLRLVYPSHDPVDRPPVEALLKVLASLP
ncbi:MAG: hypothetical protein Kow0070_23880 [Anaerolineales bacterium]